MVDRTLYRQQKTGQHQNMMTRKEGGEMVDRTPYRQQKTGQHQNTMTRKEGGNNGGQNTIYTTKDWATPKHDDQERREK